MLFGRIAEWGNDLTAVGEKGGFLAAKMRKRLKKDSDQAPESFVSFEEVNS